MSEHISYQGQDLGKIKFDEPNKIIFIAEDLGALETLLSLNPSDELETEAHGKMSYGSFRSKYLEKISAFYPSEDDWLLKNYSTRSIDEFQENPIKFLKK